MKKSVKKATKHKRPSWDEYFLEIAKVVASRSTCDRANVGAVIAKNKVILSTGYNGAPCGTGECLELGCLRNERNIPSGTQHEICRATHAEQNAIIQAGLLGVSIKGSTIYCTHTPCILCAKMLINAKISRFVACIGYPDKSFLELFKATGIVFESIAKPDLSINVLD